jgi:hypothetical protein
LIADMFSDISLALAALALFVAVALWCGLADDGTGPRQPTPPGIRPAAPLPGPGLPARATFTPRALIGTTDAHRLALVEATLARHGDDHGLRALPQVPLAAIVDLLPGATPEVARATAAAIATRQVDIAILDNRHFPLAAIMRAPADPVTTLALDRAGIALLPADPAADLPHRLAAILAARAPGVRSSPSRH